MKAPLCIVLATVILCIASNPSIGEEKHQTRDVLERGRGWNPQGPYREPPHRYPYPPYPYPYSYHPYYPSIPQQRYWESRTSPYESLEVRPAGGISVVIQPLDAHVFVDGYKLTQKEDLTYEVGLLTGLHSIEAKRKGYKPYRKEVMVEAGRTFLLTIELQSENNP